jgi:hypothetical protein
MKSAQPFLTLLCGAVFFTFFPTSLSDLSSGGIYSVDGIARSGSGSGAVSGGIYSLEYVPANPELFLNIPGKPTLKILRQGASLVISWIAPDNAYELERTADLGSGWVVLPSSQQGVAGEIRVTLPIGSQNQFLRLKSVSQ